MDQAIFVGFVSLRIALFFAPCISGVNHVDQVEKLVALSLRLPSKPSTRACVEFSSGCRTLLHKGYMDFIS